MKRTRLRRFARSSRPQGRAPEVEPVDTGRRDELRHAARQCIAIRFRDLHLICDLIDLSETGAKISVVDGMVPNAGERATLTLFDGTLIEGRVAWLRGRHIGIEFIHPVPDADERLDFEDLGRDYFGKAVTLQKSARRS
jgi:hypothetical protein